MVFPQQICGYLDDPSFPISCWECSNCQRARGLLKTCSIVSSCLILGDCSGLVKPREIRFPDFQSSHRSSTNCVSCLSSSFTAITGLGKICLNGLTSILCITKGSVDSGSASSHNRVIFRSKWCETRCQTSVLFFLLLGGKSF